MEVGSKTGLLSRILLSVLGNKTMQEKQEGQGWMEGGTRQTFHQTNLEGA